MNGAAANPNDADYAPLTSSLLARKGEASPTFDSDAYSEVMNGNEFNAPLSPIFTKNKPSPVPEAAPVVEIVVEEARSPVRPAKRQRPAGDKPRPRAAPPPQRSNKPAARFRAVRDGQDHAALTMRMRIAEYMRLRRAAKELGLSSYQILLDAIECYLDANEI